MNDDGQLLETEISLPAGYDIVGFVFDGVYRIILESSVDIDPPANPTVAQAEVLAVTYQTLGDLLGDTNRQINATKINVPNGEGIRGVAVPLPSSAAAMLGGLALAGLVVHRRRRMI